MNADYGPNSAAVTAFIESCRKLTGEELDRLASGVLATEALARLDSVFGGRGLPKASAQWEAHSAASETAWGAARRDAARDVTSTAAYQASQDAARQAIRREPPPRPGRPPRDSAWEMAGVAALALAVRDLISPAEFDTLTMPWRAAALPLPETAR